MSLLKKIKEFLFGKEIKHVRTPSPTPTAPLRPPTSERPPTFNFSTINQQKDEIPADTPVGTKEKHNVTKRSKKTPTIRTVKHNAKKN